MCQLWQVLLDVVSYYLAVLAAVTSAADSGGLLDASCLTASACFVLPARLSFASSF